MIGVGEKLRRERERQGLDLKAIEKTTRIRSCYLAAIEENRIDEIPGRFFYKSFVRQYAAALGVSPAEYESELKRIETPHAVAGFAPKQHDFPLKRLDPIVEESNRRYVRSGRIWASVVVLAAVVAACSGVYGWWRHREAAALAKIQSPAAAVVEQHPPAQVPAPAPLHPAPEDAQRAANPEVSRAAEPVAAEPAPPPAVAERAPTPEPIVLNVSAKDEVWLSVSSDGKRVFSGLLEPSESKVIGGKDPFRVRVGDAGAIEITWNGKFIGPIGERGQVRDVLFTPETYQILTPGGPL
jgi:cytoskeletal protein RodZ